MVAACEHGPYETVNTRSWLGHFGDPAKQCAIMISSTLLLPTLSLFRRLWVDMLNGITVSPRNGVEDDLTEHPLSPLRGGP